EFDVLVLEKTLVLLDQRILWSREDVDQSFLVQIMQRRNHGNASDELGNHAELDQVFRFELFEKRGPGIFRLDSDVTMKSHGAAYRQPALDEFVETDKSAAADKQDVRCIDLSKLLVGMFPAPLRRNVGDSSFKHLQQSLLNTLSRHVACDRRVFVLAPDFID